jgi:hypothetical protein
MTMPALNKNAIVPLISTLNLSRPFSGRLFRGPFVLQLAALPDVMFGD